MGCTQAEMVALLRYIREVLITKGREAALEKIDQVIEALETQHTADVLRELGLV